MKLLLHYCDKLNVMLYDLEINFSIYFHIFLVKKIKNMFKTNLSLCFAF